VQPATVGVPRETAPGERRVALVPQVVGRLRARGLTVVVEPGAGLAALIPDEQYTAAGAVLGDPWPADAVLTVTPPTTEQIGRLRPGAVVVGFLAPLTSPATIAALGAAGVHGFAMESVPRISRAQAMDALSSQANVAGYRAALLAATHLTRYFPMLTTAAGTVRPATALVLGVGVAGLQALATAKRLGARTTGYDVRPEVADQVRSLGARWLDLGIEAVGQGGYARELTENERAEQQKRLDEAVTGFDVVITTANVPGRRAPTLVTAAAVAGMRAGSVVVDLAGESGGNCALSTPGETVVHHDVTVAAPLNLPASMPEHASELYARNVVALLELMLDEHGELDPGRDDEVLAGACVTRS
jgi:NAD(P) transhydrogenase subunit alpha